MLGGFDVLLPALASFGPESAGDGLRQAGGATFAMSGEDGVAGRGGDDGGAAERA